MEVGAAVEDRLSMRGTMDDKNQGPGKEPYEPPRISVISLRPEEAVLGTCKNVSSAGPISGSCNAVVTPCSALGS